MLLAERTQHKENLESMEKDFVKKLEENDRKLKEKEEKMAELEKCLGAFLQVKPPDVQVDSPKGSPARRRKYKQKATRKSSDNATIENTSSEGRRDIFSPTASLSLEGRPKSASVSDLSTATAEQKTKNGTKTSDVQTCPNQSNSRASTTQRSTITAMVAESINNPDSITAIRKQLKADSLTPRIQRKFHQLPAARISTPKSLPSMMNNHHNSSTSSETSPLVAHQQGGGSGSAKVSPTTPRSGKTRKE